MISNELLIHRHGQGVQLSAPENTYQAEHGTTVGSIMRLPMNFYFMNRDSIMQKINAKTAETSCYLSEHDAIGKSIRDVSKRETADSILKNDREIIDTRILKITTETYTRLDDTDLTAISIKYPWYQDDNIAGIFGCSILLGQHGTSELTEALTLLMQTGLLAASATNIPGWQRKDVHFDQRDTSILRLLIRGKTAKNIARVLGISHRTVEHRLDTIKHKLAVSSKSELIERVFEQFIDLP